MAVKKIVVTPIAYLLISTIIFSLFSACSQGVPQTDTSASQSDSLKGNNASSNFSLERGSENENDFDNKNPLKFRFAYSFSDDGFAFVVYYSDDHDGEEMGIINQDGKLLSEIPLQYTDAIIPIGDFQNGFLAIKDRAIPADYIIDINGNITSDSVNCDEYDEILASGNGVFLAAKSEQGFDKNENYLVLVDAYGKCLQKVIFPLKSFESFRNSCIFIGESMWRIGTKSGIHFLYDQENNTLIDIQNNPVLGNKVEMDVFGNFEDGYVLFSNGDKKFYRFSKNADPQFMWELKNSRLLGKYSEELFWADGNFYDIEGNVILATPSEYKYHTSPLGSGSKEYIAAYPYFTGGYALLRLIGADSASYFTVIDKSGNELIEKTKYLWCSNISENKLIYSDDKGFYIFNCDSQEITKLDDNIGANADWIHDRYLFHNGLVVIDVKDITMVDRAMGGYVVAYIDGTGKKVIG